jgi:tetratricopeptide (TPR) repeat protein
MLAHRLGHDGEAVDNWQRAIDVDPAQSNAQLYLGQAFDQQGELQAAARHYRSYLEIIAARHQKNPAGIGPVLAAFIRVADADAAVHHSSDASKASPWFTSPIYRKSRVTFMEPSSPTNARCNSTPGFPTRAARPLTGSITPNSCTSNNNPSATCSLACCTPKMLSRTRLATNSRRYRKLVRRAKVVLDSKPPPSGESWTKPSRSR